MDKREARQLIELLRKHIIELDCVQGDDATDEITDIDVLIENITHMYEL